jgi:SPP1 family predicted phage head-tail adaptor
VDELMQAGRLRQQVIIENFTVTKNAFGEEIPGWATYMSTWAAVEPVRGREYMEARQVQADVDTRIRVRAQSGKTILPTMRVKFGSRIYTIQSVINVGELGKEIQLMCKEQIDA